MAREAQFLRAFVELAEVAAAAEPVEVAAAVAERCTALFDGSEAGIVTAAPEGPLRSLASSGAGDGAVGSLERRHGQGPTFDALQSEAIARCVDGADARRRWPRFAPAAEGEGIRSFTAIPLRRRGRVIGALHLFSIDTDRPAADDLPIVQGLGDLATLAIAQESADHDSRLVAQQLQTALDSRVVIEQAKGVVAERSRVGIDDAFAAIRDYARGRRQLLTDVARRIVAGDLDPAALVPHAHDRHSPITGRSGTPRGAR